MPIAGGGGRIILVFKVNGHSFQFFDLLPVFDADVGFLLKDGEVFPQIGDEQFQLLVFCRDRSLRLVGLQPFVRFGKLFLKGCNPLVRRFEILRQCLDFLFIVLFDHDKVRDFLAKAVDFLIRLHARDFELFDFQFRFHFGDLLAEGGDLFIGDGGAVTAIYVFVVSRIFELCRKDGVAVDFGLETASQLVCREAVEVGRSGSLQFAELETAGGNAEGYH